MRNLMILFLLAITVPATAIAQQPAEALQRTESLIAAFKQVHSPQKGTQLTAEQRASNQRRYTELDEHLAAEVLSGAPIEPHKAAFTAEQLKRFKTLFWETLRLVAYPSSGEFFKTAKYTIAAPKAEGKRVAVALHAALEEADLETDIVFLWQHLDGAYKLVDLRFDGASLVTDYTNQFGRIIKKKGAKGLLEVLQKRHDTLKTR